MRAADPPTDTLRNRLKAVSAQVATPDPELLELVRADLLFLAGSWQVEITDQTVKRESMQLRRLLLDRGGTLAVLRKAMELTDPVMIVANDLVKSIPSPWLDVRMAAAGGCTIGVVSLGISQSSISGLSPTRHPQVRSHFTLHEFLDAPSIIVRGQGVPRRIVLNYVANKLGGAHWDTSRSAKPAEKLMTLLDLNRHDMWVMGLDLVHTEVLGIGQHLLRSPHVQVLLPDPVEVPHLPNL